MQQLNIITTLAGLEAIRDEWEELYERSIIRSPLTTFTYIRMWYTTFDAHRTMRIYRVQVGDTLLGFMPLVLKKGRFGIRQLGNLVNEHCRVSYPLVAQGYEHEFRQKLLTDVIVSASSWDIFTHDFSFCFSPLHDLFCNAQLTAAGHQWEKTIAPTYTIMLSETFAQYWNQLPSKSFKKSIRNAQNRLNREKNVRFLRVENTEALASWPQFLEIESSGWKGAAGTAIMHTEAVTQQYYRDFLQILADTNNLYLYMMQIDDVLVAAEFGYVDGDIFQSVKSAYDERFAKLSPSHLLALYVIEDLILLCAHVKRYHLFPWDTGYKQKFINESTSYMTTTIYGQTVRGQLFLYARQLKELVKKRLPGVFVVVKKIAEKWQEKTTKPGD